MLFDRQAKIRDQEAMAWLMRLTGRESGVQGRFYAWLLRSPRNVGAFLAVAEADRDLSNLDPQHTIDVERLIAASQARITPLRSDDGNGSPVASRPGKPFTWRLAASIAALAILAGSLLHAIHGAAFTRPEYKTAIGEQREIKLDDGSLIHMNAHSRLRVDYTSQHRRIRLLDGEALFVVNHDAARPFLVVADRTTIQALGTEFNVYRRQGRTTVSVLDGAVRIGDSAALAPPLPPLTAGEQAVTQAHQVVKVARPDVGSSVAWRRRELAFQQTPLSEVAIEFNRYNRRQLQLADGNLARKEISGIFSADYPQSLILFLQRDPALEVRETGDGWMVKYR